MKKSLLLSLLLIAVANLVWAQDPVTLTWDFKTTQDIAANANGFNINLKSTTNTVGSWVFYGKTSSAGNDAKGPRVGSKDKPVAAGATLTLSGSEIPQNATVTKVVFTIQGNATKAASKWHVEVGSVSTEDKSASGDTSTELTWDNLSLAGNDVVIKLSEKSSYGFHLQRVEVTYTTAGQVDPPVTEPQEFKPNFVDPLVMTVGDTKDVAPAGADIPEIIYISNDDAIATVSDEGVVTAVAEGTTTITAAWEATDKWLANEDGVTFTVNVKAPVREDFVPGFKNLEMAVGDTKDVTPAGDNIPEIVYVSNNNAIATVSEAGVVTALAEGTAIITAMWDESNKWNANLDGVTFTVTVTPPSNWVLVTDAASLRAGDQVILAARDNGCAVSNASEADFRQHTAATFNADKTAINQTSDMMVFELGKDDAKGWTLKTTNYAGTDGYLGNHTSQNQAKISTSLGNGYYATITFNAENKATIKFADTTKGNFQYNGGSPRFACYASNNSGNYELVSIYRKDTPREPQDFVYTFEDVTMTEGDTKSVMPEGSRPDTFVFDSDNKDIADIDDDGVITAKAAGEATISVMWSDEAGNWNDGEAEFKVVVEERDPNAPQTITATFDFAPAGAYGLTTFTSSNNEYEKKVASATEQEASLALAGGQYRQWSGNKGNDFRIYTNATMTFSVPEGCAIKSVIFYPGNSNDFGVKTPDNASFTQQKEGNTILSRTWTATATDLREAVFTATKTSTMKAVDVVYELVESALYLPATLPVFEGYENGVKVGDVVKITPSHRTHTVSWRVVPGEEIPAEVAYMRAAATDWTLHDVEGASVEHTIESLDEPYILLAKSVDRRGVESDVHGLKISTDGNAMTGIENVAADTASEAVYYNLQGVRVDGTPAAGVYVRLRGGKASKVVVK